MTPNLTKLFAQATKGPMEVSPGDTSAQVYNADGTLRLMCAVEAGTLQRRTIIPDFLELHSTARLLALLATHGEEMILALEACADGFSRPGGASLLVRSQVYALLATLEREVQP